MLSTRVIACLDVHNGRTVKGINFINRKDAGDPVEQARQYSIIGADEICFLDFQPPMKKEEQCLMLFQKLLSLVLYPLLLEVV